MATHRFEDLSFFGGLVIGYFSEGPLQAVQAKPKTPLPKFTSQKGMECDWTGEK